MFTPTKEELEEIGFILPSKEGYPSNLLISRKNDILLAYWEEEGFTISIDGCGCDIYPQSIEDIKTLIRLFTKS